MQCQFTQTRSGHMNEGASKHCVNLVPLWLHIIHVPRTLSAGVEHPGLQVNARPRPLKAEGQTGQLTWGQQRKERVPEVGKCPRSANGRAAVA